MDREKLQSFITTAEAGLVSVRGSLLIVAQTGGNSDLLTARRDLARLKHDAEENGRTALASQIAECESAIDLLASTESPSPNSAYAALDLVAGIEAALWQIPQHPEDFLSDIMGFVDASLDEIMPHVDEPDGSNRADEEFEIDDETLEIFRSEADELLANIANDLQILSSSPGDQNALWDIRRNAHTFKGAAGIVGLKDASLIAHRMEDLLDKIVELRREATPQIVDFLAASASRLVEIVAAKNIDDEPGRLETKYADVMKWLASEFADEVGIIPNDDDLPNSAAPPRVDAVRTTTTPIVRVSLDRLDELIKISRSLLINRSAIAERFAQFNEQLGFDGDAWAKLESLFETQRNLTDAMHTKLLRIRMVKFGTLETRLSRAVHATCLDENKKAVVEIENGEVEIDTQIIDALIEPLLHLLKNAVVHGIEPPETRRLIGKPERGNIRVRLEADLEALILSVSDDGGGISTAKLKEKAVASCVITADEADQMDDRTAMQLIFDRGLTTADKIDLNAGRGVGMSIVKESVENRGGRVLIESDPRRGTTFTILMPLTIVKPEPNTRENAEKAENPAPLVLVVDDSASVRRQTTKLVEAEGFRVITAGNGAEALELLLSGDWIPDLILSDVEMPQIDGWEFLEYIKTDANLGHIPVVMVTSLNTDAYRQRAIDLGAADYITKPLSKEFLTRKILDCVLVS